jgi:WD40 repeat protein
MIWETATWTIVDESSAKLYGKDGGAVGLSPDGKLMARATWDDDSTTVILLETREQVHVFRSWASILVFSPDNRVLVLGSAFGVRAYDTKAGSELWTLDTDDVIKVLLNRETDSEAVRETDHEADSEICSETGSEADSEIGSETEGVEMDDDHIIKAIALSSNAKRFAMVTYMRFFIWNVEDP